MKPALRPLAALALLAFLAAPLARAEEAATPRLRSVLIDGPNRLFSLADATGAGTWVKLGDSYEGWRLAEFDAAAQALTLERDGARRRLVLETAVIRESEARATLADAEAVLQKMRFEEMIEKSIRAQQEAMAKAMTKAPGMPDPTTPQGARVAEFQAKVLDVMLQEMDLPGMRGDMAKVMSEVFTASELRAQADFYSTPAGQSAIDKQPELQRRMTEIMMPRMMKAMPKVQAMSQEFARKEAEAKSASPAPAPAAP